MLVALSALITAPAAAVIYTGTPTHQWHCSFVDKNDPDVTLLDEVWMQGTVGVHDPNDVVFECDDPWATIEFGTVDLNPNPNYWRYNLWLVTDSTSTSYTECHIYYNDVLYSSVEVYAYL